MDNPVFYVQMAHARLCSLETVAGERGVTRLPLIDVSAALNWRGWPHAWRDHMVRTVRNYPRADAWLKRALGKPLSHKEN